MHDVHCTLHTAHGTHSPSCTYKCTVTQTLSHTTQLTHTYTVSSTHTITHKHTHKIQSTTVQNTDTLAVNRIDKVISWRSCCFDGTQLK